jgi:hypothetical protein
MKVSKEDKNPPRVITEKQDIDTVNDNKEIEDARKKLAEDQKRLDELEEKKKRKDKLEGRKKSKRFNRRSSGCFKYYIWSKLCY